jgi:hypothetical protein
VKRGVVRWLVLVFSAIAASHAGHSEACDWSTGLGFEETTELAGVSFTGPSYGASWGDFNGDRLPDLWVSNHEFPSSLFVNLGAGRFRRSDDLIIPNTPRDKHGAAWGDFDGDGDNDLIQVVGGANPNLLYVNTGGFLVDSAAAYGIDLPGVRSRSASWLDLDNDGRLDLVLLNDLGGTGQLSGSAVFMNRGSYFENATDAVGLLGSLANYASVTDFDADGQPDLVVESLIPPRAIYRIGSSLEDLTSGATYSPQNGSGTDTVFADFDNDGVQELFLTRAGTNNGAELISPSEAWVSMAMTGGERSFSFSTEEAVTFSIHQIFSRSSSIVKIGSSGFSPVAFTFTLEPDDPLVEGVPSFSSGQDLGVFVGRDPASGKWILRFSSPFSQELRVTVRAESEITELETIGFDPVAIEPWPTLYRLEAGRYVERRTDADLGFGMACHSVVAGDFDNDMDIDLYLACTGAVRNRPNLLLENLGAGRFRKVPGAGNAEGTTLGRADMVVAADYDGDGFLDLFVANGLGGDPFRIGPNQLFRNCGNQNHWLTVAVRRRPGSADSNDGAKVVVEAGGIRQIREYNGGYHRKGQNSSLLHFGLGPSSVADRVELTLPGGEQIEYRNVAANRLIVVGSGPACGLGWELAVLALAGKAAGGMASRRHASTTRTSRDS